MGLGKRGLREDSQRTYEGGDGCWVRFEGCLYGCVMFYLDMMGWLRMGWVSDMLVGSNDKTLGHGKRV